MITPITFIKAAAAWCAAHIGYYRTTRELNDVVADLHTTDVPVVRAVLLSRWGDLEAHLAALHTAAFGVDPIPGEDDRPMATSLASSATLVRLVASTERLAAVYHGTAVDQVGPVIDAEGWLSTAWTVAESQWEELGRTVDRARRAELLLVISDLVAPYVGAQAAEALVTVAATETYLADMAAGRAPSPYAEPLSRGAIATVFAGLGTAVTAPALWQGERAAELLLTLVGCLAVVAGASWLIVHGRRASR